MKAVKQTTYLVERDEGGNLKVTVPSAWRVTFGQTSPNKYGGGDRSLRFYEGTKQRAIFTGVTAFRDLAIGVERQIVEAKIESSVEITDKRETRTSDEQRTERWEQA